MSVDMSGFINNGSTVGRADAPHAASDAAGRAGQGGQSTLTLQAGEQIRGTVIETDGSRVVIETRDHAVFSARLENGMQVNKGDVMDFEVRGRIGKQIALTPLYSNMSVDSSVWKALQAASLPATEAHVRMVNEMMSQGMGIDRQSLHSMAGLVARYGTTDPALLVQMRQIGVPISPESVMQMEQYRNNTAQILSGFEEIGARFEGLLQEMAGNGEYEALGKLFTEAMKLFLGGELAGENQALSGGEGAQASAAQQTAGGAALSGAGPDGGVPLTDGAFGELQNPSGAAGTAQGGAESGNIADASADVSQTAGRGASSFDGISRLMADFSLTPETAAGKETAVSSSGSLAQGAAQGPGGMQEAAQGPEAMREETQEQRTASEGKAPAQEQTADAGQASGAERAGNAAGAERISAFMKSFLESFGSKAAQGTEAQAYYDAGKELAALLHRPQFRNAVGSAIIRKWLLAPQDVSGKEQVQELYEKVLRQTGRLAQLLSEAGKQDSPAMKSLQNMERNVEFLNELNQHFAYVQLPLKMSGQNAHGDLYVYTNKKGFAGRDGAVTAFLHLGMDHLGDMDIYVALLGQKVTTKFYLEDDSLIDFLEGHMEELDARLAGKGYTVKAELLRRDHEDGGNVFEEMLKDSKSAGMAPMVMLSRQSFDARA